MRSDTVADSGVYAPRHFCDFRVGVQVDKIQRTLSAAGGEGVGNLLANPPAPTVDSGVAQVDAVTDLSQLVASLGRTFDWYSHLIQPGFATKPARTSSQRTTQSFGGVDVFSLVAAVLLNKSASCCFEERKYLSSTSLIKISDNVHPVS